MLVVVRHEATAEQHETVDGRLVGVPDRSDTRVGEISAGDDDRLDAVLGQPPGQPAGAAGLGVLDDQHAPTAVHDGSLLAVSAVRSA